MKILVFKTSRCPPCNRISPHISKLEKEGYPIEVVEEDQMEEFAKYAVANVPTILVVNGEEIMHRSTGYKDEREILQIFNSFGLTSDQE